MLLAVLVLVGRVVGNSKQMTLNGVSDAGGIIVGGGSWLLCSAGGGDDNMDGGWAVREDGGSESV